jgi:hypothetical protein
MTTKTNATWEARHMITLMALAIAIAALIMV